MDLKAYYQKIRELEQGFQSAYPVVVSLETADGGAAGVKTEAPPRIAAKMIVEGRARLADAAEAKDFEEQKMEATRAADKLQTPGRMQVTLVSDGDLRALRGTRPAAKQ